MKILKTSLAFALIMGSSLLAVTTARATTFTAPVTSGSQDGLTLDGFTFHGYWANYGNDSVNAPFMEMFDQSHSLTFDAGSFDFQSFTLSGFPWDNYGYVTGDGLLSFHLKDINGVDLFSDQVNLPRDNSFNTYYANVSGVHEIVFDATGGYIGQDGGWKGGFWPRLSGINEGSNVPDTGATLVTLGSALLGLAALRRRFVS